MTEKKTILIVDDQESIIKALKRLLLTESYEILSAEDGPSALEIIKEHQEEIFLIISDQRMPHMTGTMFLEKAVEMIPDTTRFILSGYADRDDVIMALNDGIAHRYLTKPWNSDELLLMINQAHEFPEKIRDKDIIDAHLRNTASGFSESNVMDRELKQFNDNRNDRALGKIAVHHGFITQRQLDASLTAMQSARQAGRKVSLENILFEKGLLSSEDMGKILAATRRKIGKTFGSVAMSDFGVSRADLDRCLAIQAQEFKETTTCRLLGDILVTEKILTEEQKESIIIDQIYSERDILNSDSDRSIDSDGNNSVADSDKSGNHIDIIRNEVVRNKRKKNFFRQRALDKIFCKSAINKNFATETEVLKALEEQLLHFTKTFEIKSVADILIERSIISHSQAETINTAISHPQLTQVQVNEIESKKSTLPERVNTEAEAQIQETPQKRVGNERSIAIDNNNAFELTINAENTEATIRLTGDMPEGITVEQLKELLSRREIIYGLADDVSIELFLRQAITQKEGLVIAKGRPVKAGRNALVKYYFENENERFGKELESGKFDYRDRGEILNVTQGTLLAEKIPIIPAANGVTIFGIEIPAPALMDVNLDCGQGVVLSKDGLKATATVNGRPDISLGGKISIMNTKTVKGNVDFKTGNIKFNGDIIVQGNILAGFSVIGNNLTVNHIEEADVNIANTLIAKNSINSSTIRTGGHLTAQIIKKSTIFVHGDVAVQKEIIDCTIVCSGRVIIPRGRIVASRIYAAKGIEAMYIGSEVSVPCYLFPGADDHANTILKNFSEKLDSNEKHLVKLEAVEKQYERQSLKQLNDLTELSRLQEKLAMDKKKTLEDKKSATNEILKKQINEYLGVLYKKSLKMDETINKLFDENDAMQIKSKEIKAKIKAVKAEIQHLLNEKNGFERWYDEQKQDARKKRVGVSVHGTIFAGTKITGTECAIILKNQIKNSIIRQVMNSNDPVKPFHEMRIEPLSATGKPHVYRT